MEDKRCYCGNIADYKANKMIKSYFEDAEYLCAECVEDLADKTKGKIYQFVEFIEDPNLENEEDLEGEANSNYMAEAT